MRLTDPFSAAPSRGAQDGIVATATISGPDRFCDDFEECHMKKIMLGTLAAAAMLAPVTMPTAAFAQPGYNSGGYNHDGRDNRGNDNGNGNGGGQWRGGDRNWDPARDYRNDGRRRGDRRLGRDDQVYRGHDGRYYCKRNDGTTGTVIGAVGGGLAGNLLGGGTLGTLLGAGGGALLGRSIDRGNVKCR